MTDEVTKWYENHKDEYREIEQDLSDVKDKFLNTDKETQKSMLINSFEFAVISIQTIVDRHEQAFKDLKDGKGIDEALSSVVYKNQKKDWIIRTRLKKDKINKVVELLNNGQIDKAHRFMIDEFVGVSTVKAAFTLCMLGFTEKACIDTNILSFLDGSIEVYDGVVVEKYDNFCQKALPEIKDKEPFLRQWITFDFMRNVIERHKVYFNVQKDV